MARATMNTLLRHAPSPITIAALCIALCGCVNHSAKPAYCPPPPQTLTADRRAALEADLSAAEKALRANPRSEDAAIWVARRLGYLGRYEDAIDTLTRAAAEHPRSYRILRHRGHRWITVRRFDLAIADLSRAWQLAKHRPDRIEPDGAPTPCVPPRSTDQSNILYHLALAHYLRAEYAPAARLFAQAADLPLTNDDNRVSCAHWRYLALMRLSRAAEAQALLRTITPDMDVRENAAYLRLLILYKSPPPAALPPDSDLADPAYAYGVAAHLMLHRRTSDAHTLLFRITQSTNPASFGHLAAEADLRHRPL